MIISIVQTVKFNKVSQMTDLTKFHALSHIFISLIGSILLLALWYNIIKRFKQILQDEDSKQRVDKGLLYLGLSIFVWVISGCLTYVKYLFSPFELTYYNAINNFISIINDFFLLLALFYFDDAPGFIYKNKRNISTITLVVFITSGLTFFLQMLLQDKNEMYNIRISAIPDFILSGFLTFLLMVAFYRTFVNRDMKVVAFISSIVIVLVFVSILPDVFLNLYSDFVKNLIKIIAKTSFIAISLVLATSWVIQLASTPKPSEMAIKFIDWSLIKITIPSKGIYDTTIEFGSKTTQYRNLLKFAIRRKFGGEASQSILISLGGEIKNQTYLSRIIDNINEIIPLTDDQKLDRRDLFTFIGQGYYRLRVIPENILIDETLLCEFVNSADNQEYKSICNLL